MSSLFRFSLKCIRKQNMHKGREKPLCPKQKHVQTKTCTKLTTSQQMRTGIPQQTMIYLSHVCIGRICMENTLESMDMHGFSPASRHRSALKSVLIYTYLAFGNIDSEKQTTAAGCSTRFSGRKHRSLDGKCTHTRKRSETARANFG